MKPFCFKSEGVLINRSYMGFILQSFGILLSSGGREVAVKCVNNAFINMVNNGLAYKSNVCIWDEGGFH